jgi:ABC-2 type transport system ATP-binding protein
MSHEVIIETRNLTKVYRDFWGRPKVQALKALDLQVHRGEIFGLLGPNGSGKTTTIKLLLGLLFATEGEALIFNEPTSNVSKNERIGYLPEESYLYKFLNAEETLHFYGRLFKISSAERTKRVGRLIDMVGLTGAKHRQLREYSKGMQRRIGLAQALINDPELILLDEPTSGLDPIGTSEIKHLIRELRERGKTIVLSGHLLADMQDICDRIAILHRGELKEIGRVSDLLTVQDVTQVKARNLSQSAVDEIRDVIRRHGGEDVTVDHPTTTLEELFLRIVQESELHPGRRKVARDAGKPTSPAQGELAGARAKS